MNPEGAIPPTEVAVVGSGGGLSVVWGTARQVMLEARRLRGACRCAACTAAKISGGLSLSEDIRIDSIAGIGAYAISVRFSDGHARGIYPWAYLRDLAVEFEDRR
jgi:DUF971 family protein